MTFNSTILIVPGLGSSGPEHWQSIWQNRFGFKRVEQQDWKTPVCADWIEKIQNDVQKYNPAEVILVAHSLACGAVAHWANRYKIKIKGALLVAPADPEAVSFPPEPTGFSPIPLNKLPFRSIIVISTTDPFASVGRAELFAESWGSELVNIGDAGHINISSGFGEWDAGLDILKQLDDQPTCG